MPVSRDAFYADIISQRKRLDEYAVPDQMAGDRSPDLLECYIESQEGLKYKVQCGHESRHGVPYDVRIYIFVDGKKVSASYLRKGQNSIRAIEGARTKDGKSIAPFLFTKLETAESDDEYPLPPPEDLKDLGTIKIHFHKCVLDPVKQLTRPRVGVKEDSRILQDQEVKVQEKRKKTLSERTGYGELKPVRPSKYFNELLSEEETPFLRIVVHYMSGPLLELRGIKPPTPDVPEEFYTRAGMDVGGSGSGSRSGSGGGGGYGGLSLKERKWKEESNKPPSTMTMEMATRPVRLPENNIKPDIDNRLPSPPPADLRIKGVANPPSTPDVKPNLKRGSPTHSSSPMKKYEPVEEDSIETIVLGDSSDEDSSSDDEDEEGEVSRRFVPWEREEVRSKRVKRDSDQAGRRGVDIDLTRD